MHNSTQLLAVDEGNVLCNLRTGLYTWRVSSRAPAAPYYALVVDRLKRDGKGKLWLSQRSGVSRNTVDNWAKQPKPPQPATVLAVADVLGIDHDEALRLAGISPTATEPEEGEPVDLSKVSIDDLLAEVRRRVKD